MNLDISLPENKHKRIALVGHPAVRVLHRRSDVWGYLEQKNLNTNTIFNFFYEFSLNSKLSHYSSYSSNLTCEHVSSRLSNLIFVAASTIDLTWTPKRQFRIKKRGKIKFSPVQEYDMYVRYNQGTLYVLSAFRKTLFSNESASALRSTSSAQT